MDKTTEDRVREYAEAVRFGSRSDEPNWVDVAARACVEVEERHTAALRDRIGRIESGWRRTNAAVIEEMNRADSAEAELERLRGELKIAKAALRSPEPTKDIARAVAAGIDYQWTKDADGTDEHTA